MGERKNYAFTRRWDATQTVYVLADSYAEAVATLANDSSPENLNIIFGDIDYDNRRVRRAPALDEPVHAFQGHAALTQEPK